MTSEMARTNYLKLAGRYLSVLGPFLGLLFVYLIFSFSADEAFRSLYNTKTILQQSVIIGIAALGMTIIIISAGIDLSAGSLVAVSTVVVAKILNPHLDAEEPLGLMLPLMAAGAGVLACGLFGMFNGALIAGFGIVPFIVTLGTMQIARGVAKWMAEQTTIDVPKTWLSEMMIIEPVKDATSSMAPAVWLLIVLLAAMIVMLRYTTFGRHIFAVGSSEATARLCGIRVKLHRLWVYTIGGLFFGVAGVMQFSSLNLGDPTSGIALELDVIAAVVIGGGSFNGGEGSVAGSVIGAIIIAILRNGCNMVGVENYVQNIVIGSIIIGAVGIDQLRHRNRA